MLLCQHASSSLATSSSLLVFSRAFWRRRLRFRRKKERNGIASLLSIRSEINLSRHFRSSSYSSAISRPIETSNSMLFVLPIPDLSLPLSPSNKCRSSLPPLTARRISVCSGREEEHLTYVTSVKWRNQSTPAECEAGRVEELCTRASFQKHLCTLDQLSVVSLGMFMFGSYGTDRKCCLFFSYTITRFLPSSVPSSLTSSCLFPATRAS